MASQIYNEKSSKTKENINQIESTTAQRVLENKLGGCVDSQPRRKIRIIENKIEKIEAKFQEALQIKKNYEIIAKQLMDEKVGWEAQLTSLESSLKDSEHDINELKLLKHDAVHSKEVATKTLHQLSQHPQTSSQPPENDMEPNQPLQEKPKDKKKLKMQASIHEPSEQITVHDDADQETLRQYESLYHKLKEASGEADITDILQKYSSLEVVTTNLLEQKKTKEAKLFQLNREKVELKEKLESYRMTDNKEITREELTCKESELDIFHAKNEVAKSSTEELLKIEIDVVAGISHLRKSLSKYITMDNASKSEEEILDTFIMCAEKMKNLYNFYKSDSDFIKILASRSSINYNDAYLEEMMGKKGKPFVYMNKKNNKLLYKAMTTNIESKQDLDRFKARIESEIKVTKKPGKPKMKK
jgi:hypothetical protein